MSPPANLKRINRAEAKKDEAKILKARGEFEPELLKWVACPEYEITQDLDRFLDKMMVDRRRRVEVFLTALTRKYVERAVFFVGQLPGIEEELLDPRRIKTMKNSDLIRLLCTMADQVKDASDFLRNFVSDEVLKSEPVPTPGAGFGDGEKQVEVEDISDDEKEVANQLPVESRQRIGGILRKVLAVIDKTDDSVEVLPPPAESGKKDPAKAKTEGTSKKSKGGKS